MKYTIVFTREAKKDVTKLTPKLKKKLKTILEKQIAPHPQIGKKLTGDLTGFFSFRLSYKDRLVYRVDQSKHRVIVYRAKTHYGE